MQKVISVKVFVWVLLFSLFCFQQIPVLLAAEPPSLGELKQFHHEHWQAIQTGTLVVRFSSMNVVDKDIVTERERELKDTFESRKSRILQNLSQEEKDKMVQKLNQNYEDTALYSFQKNNSERSEAERIYNIDLINRRSSLQEIPVAVKDLNEDFINGAWNRTVLTTGDGYYLTYHPEFENVMLSRLSKTGVNTHYLVLYLGIIKPDQWNELPQNCTIEKSQINGQEVVIYTFFDSNRPGDKLVIYTDPSVRYRYLKMESVSKGQLYRTLLAKNYKSFDTILFPTYHEDVRFDDTGAVRQKEILEIKEAHFNQPFDPNAFTVDLTSETHIAVDIVPDQIKLFQPNMKNTSKIGISDILEQAAAIPAIRRREK